jgi:localization factor PodJL
MTAGAPWSVKGIDPKAREVAKDLARRSGMTLGEWLNRMILEDDPEDAVTKALFGDRPARPQRTAAEPPPPFAQFEAAPGSREDIARVALALDRLTDHIEASETRTGLAISGVEQSVRAALSRLESTERQQAAVVARVEGVVDGVRNEHAKVVDRVRRVEQEAAGPRSAEALRALETALSKVAGQLAQKDDRARDLLSAVESRIQRLEGGEAASSAVVEDSFGQLSGRLADAEGRTAQAVENLRDSFAALDGRLRAVESGGGLDQRLEELAATLGQRLDEARGEIAAQLAASAEDRFDRMERKLGEMAGHVQAAEQRSALAIQKMGEDLAGVAGSLTERVQAAEAGAAAVGAELAKIGDGQAEALSRLSAEVTRISERLSERIAGAERRSAQAIDEVGEKLGKFNERLGQRTDKVSEELSERIRASEARTARLLEEAREKIDQRLAEANQRLAEQARAAQPPVPQAPEPRLPPAETLDEPIAAAAAPAPFSAASSLFGAAFPLARSERAQPEPAFDETDFEAAAGFAPTTQAASEGLEPAELAAGEPEQASPPQAADPLADVLSALDAEPPAQTLSEDDAELLKPPALEPAAAFDVEPADASAPTADEPATSAGAPMWPRPEPGRLNDGFDDEREDEAEVAASDPDEAAPAAADAAEADDLFEPRAEPAPPLERLTARELIEQARAAARASAAGQKPAKPRAKADEEGAGLFSGFTVAKKRRAGGTLPTAVLVAGGMAAAGLSISGLVLQSGEIQKGADQAQVAAQGAKAAPAVAPKAPLAAVALSPKKLTETAPPAASDVDLETLYAEASRSIDAGEPAGLAKLKQAANLGHAPAQFHLAKLYEAGHSGLKQDLAEARRWTERAAQRGERKAMHNLALYYFEGTGGPKNTSTAAQWFQRAAEMGLVDSQYNLGRLHEEGIGVPQNAAEAYRWYLIAGRAGDAESRASSQRVKAELSAEARVVAEKSAASFRAATPSLASDGDKATVAMAQKALSRLNYYQVLGPADGVSSPALRMAVAAYQRDQGLPTTGELDSLTVSRLAVYAR